MKQSSKIAVVFDDRVTAGEIKKLKKTGAFIAELRFDLFSRFDTAHVLDQIRKAGSLPKIATIRSRIEGGKWKFSEAERLKLFRIVIPKVDRVDIELSSRKILKTVIKMARKHKTKVIVSYHNFKKTPSDVELEKIIRAARRSGADIVKIATFIKTERDLLSLIRLTLRHADQKVIVIGMGPKGAVSRILFPGLGSLFTYVSLKQAVAPGQFSYFETARLFKSLYSSK